ncbi:hypothetical protein NEFER03_0441 [Nematocida sp. LUAm3]|nr:hypothetical protein NEFER03_0441 [Nematocida sp. LUAm3]KAI5175899.1 hypothetical protein NEFER02_1759 [Nematocida sp. LUAm2]KAI5178719.1 hypothetical protein NEFER01_1838 [Nematocida sp. LUAm1]
MQLSFFIKRATLLFGFLFVSYVNATDIETMSQEVYNRLKRHNIPWISEYDRKMNEVLTLLSRGGNTRSKEEIFKYLWDQETEENNHEIFKLVSEDVMYVEDSDYCGKIYEYLNDPDPDMSYSTLMQKKLFLPLLSTSDNINEQTRIIYILNKLCDIYDYWNTKTGYNNMFEYSRMMNRFEDNMVSEDERAPLRGNTNMGGRKKKGLFSSFPLSLSPLKKTKEPNVSSPSSRPNRTGNAAEELETPRISIDSVSEYWELFYMSTILSMRDKTIEMDRKTIQGAYIPWLLEYQRNLSASKSEQDIKQIKMFGEVARSFKDLYRIANDPAFANYNNNMLKYFTNTYPNHGLSLNTFINHPRKIDLFRTGLYRISGRPKETPLHVVALQIFTIIHPFKCLERVKSYSDRSFCLYLSHLTLEHRVQTETTNYTMGFEGVRLAELENATERRARQSMCLNIYASCVKNTEITPWDFFNEETIKLICDQAFKQINIKINCIADEEVKSSLIKLIEMLRYFAFDKLVIYIIGKSTKQNLSLEEVSHLNTLLHTDLYNRYKNKKKAPPHPKLIIMGYYADKYGEQMAISGSIEYMAGQSFVLRAIRSSIRKIQYISLAYSCIFVLGWAGLLFFFSLNMLVIFFPLLPICIGFLQLMINYNMRIKTRPIVSKAYTVLLLVIFIIMTIYMVMCFTGLLFTKDIPLSIKCLTGASYVSFLVINIFLIASRLFTKKVSKLFGNTPIFKYGEIAFYIASILFSTFFCVISIFGLISIQHEFVGTIIQSNIILAMGTFFLFGIICDLLHIKVNKKTRYTDSSNTSFKTYTRYAAIFAVLTGLVAFIYVLYMQGKLDTIFIPSEIKPVSPSNEIIASDMSIFSFWSIFKNKLGYVSS